MVLCTATPLLSLLPMLLSLDPFPYYSQCDICTLCYVDMCRCVYVCVCVCVLFSTACVSCFWLGAEPCPMIGFTAPPRDVTARSVPEWEKPLCSCPARECFPVCVCWRLFLCGTKLASCYLFLWNLVHLRFEASLDFGKTENRNWISFATLPSRFQGKCVFQTTGMFSVERGWLLDCVVQQLCNTKIDFFLPRDLFYLLPSFLPVALVILIPQSFISSLRRYAVKSQASPSASIAPPSNVQNFVCSPLLSVCNGCSASPSDFGSFIWN